MTIFIGGFENVVRLDGRTQGTPLQHTEMEKLMNKEKSF